MIKPPIVGTPALDLCNCASFLTCFFVRKTCFICKAFSDFIKNGQQIAANDKWNECSKYPITQHARTKERQTSYEWHKHVMQNTCTTLSVHVKENLSRLLILLPRRAYTKHHWDPTLWRSRYMLKAKLTKG